MVSLAKLLLNFFLEKNNIHIYVMLKMLMVLFKIVAQINFIYHIQAKTIGLQPS